MIPHLDRLVCVEWEDAWTSDSWHSQEDTVATGEPLLVHTVGWVLIEDEGGMTLAQSLTDGGAGAIWRVPAGMIRQVRILREGKEA